MLLIVAPTKQAWSPRHQSIEESIATAIGSPHANSPLMRPGSGGLTTHRSALSASTALEYSADDRDDDLDIHSDEQQPKSQQPATSPTRLLRRQHNEELLAILEKEQEREAERVRTLEECADDKEKVRLGHIFAEERTTASEQILALSLRHEKELDDLMNQDDTR